LARVVLSDKMARLVFCIAPPRQVIKCISRKPLPFRKLFTARAEVEYPDCSVRPLAIGLLPKRERAEILFGRGAARPRRQQKNFKPNPDASGGMLRALRKRIGVRLSAARAVLN
jgi:hypothetical protein